MKLTDPKIPTYAAHLMLLHSISPCSLQQPQQQQVSTIFYVKLGNMTCISTVTILRNILSATQNLELPLYLFDHWTITTNQVRLFTPIKLYTNGQTIPPDINSCTTHGCLRFDPTFLDFSKLFLHLLTFPTEPPHPPWPPISPIFSESA